MIGVTSEIKRLLKEKDRAIITGEKAMLGIMENLHKQIVSELGIASLTPWETYHLKTVLNNIENIMSQSQDTAKKKLTDLLDTTYFQGTDFVNDILRAGELSVGVFRIGRGSIDALTDYSSSYLEKLYGDAWHGIKAEITLGILGVKSPREVAAAIGTTISSGRFGDYAIRAKTITRTEMGRIFSEAAQHRMEEAAGHVEGLEKQWVHAGSPREPRPSHVVAHGQHVPVNNPFIVGAYKMMFPRDPKAPVSEIIHCGCDHAPYHEKWENELPAANLAPYGETKTEAMTNFVTQSLKHQEFRDFYAGKRGGNFPVAFLDDSFRKEIGASSDIVYMGEWTMKKQRGKITGNAGHPELSIDEYRKLPRIVSPQAQVIIKDSNTTMVFVGLDGRYYHAAIKATESGKGLFLQSFRRVDDVGREVARLTRKKGIKVIKNEL